MNGAGRLQGKRVFLTAAGQGIGRACALACAREGAEVIASDRDGGLLEALAAEEPKLRTEILDVTDATACEDVAARVGRVDGLASLAGFVHAGSVLECATDDLRAAFDLNVLGMHQVVRAFAPAMVDAGAGSIVLMSSVAGAMTGVPNRYVYCATKAAVLGMARSIAADLVQKGVRCNAVCPGTVESPSLRDRIREQAATQGATEQATLAAFEARQPMGRIGQPDEIAALVVYLLADESAYTTGQGHVIDGGWCT